MRIALMVSAVGVAMALVACSGSSSSPTVARLGSAPTTTVAPGGRTSAGGAGASVENYTSCLRAHGLTDIPDAVPPTGGPVILRLPSAVTQTALFTSAAKACKSLLPPGTLNPSFAFTAQQRHDYLAAADCMRAHGITGFPDPVFSSGGIHYSIPPGIDANSSQFLRAQQTCRKLIPAGLPYSS